MRNPFGPKAQNVFSMKMIPTHLEGISFSHHSNLQIFNQTQLKKPDLMRSTRTARAVELWQCGSVIFVVALVFAAFVSITEFLVK